MIIKKIKYFIMKFRWKNKCSLASKTVVDRNAVFEGKNAVRENSKILNSKLGYATYVGENCFLKNALIGKYTCIANDVKTISGAHPTSQYVSIHPAFYSKITPIGLTYSEKDYFKEYEWLDEKKNITIKIGNDVWIGEGVRILDGVKIDDGAIIAAGAVVVKDVPAYAVVGGVPAKIIKYRFKEEQIKKLLQCAWWNRDEAWIKACAIKFRDIEEFLRSEGSYNGENS